jgi:hypothetical protein
VSSGRGYGQLISEQLIEERDRKKTLEQRGNAVITTSSVIASLLLGLGAIAGDSFVLTPNARPFVLWALVAFVVSAFLAVGTSMPFRYTEATVPGLRKLVTKERWRDDAETVAASTASLEIDILQQARSWNRVKAFLLMFAIGSQVLAVGLTAMAVWRVLSSPPGPP